VPGRLHGLVGLITGGGSGLGRAVARRFVAEGARVTLFDHRLDRLEHLRAEITPESIHVIHGDVTRPADNARAVAETIAAFGRLDVFVGNAGVFDNMVRLRDVPLESVGPAFDELFGVDVKGYLLGARAALEELEKSNGSIVFTASTSGLAPGYGGVFYVPAKHAVVGLTRQLAWELAPGIRVNAVAPGYVPTNLDALATLHQTRRTASPEMVLPRIPVGMVPSPDDLAGLYVTLAAPSDNRFVTGTVVLADGGQTMWGPPH
jgi:NAD(P)-dependent dehydrogenase (short-subunit alcohol dehydrogenase family)